MSADWDRYIRAIRQVTEANSAEGGVADELDRERVRLNTDIEAKYRAAVDKIAGLRTANSKIAADARELASSTKVSPQIRPIEISHDVEAAIREAAQSLQAAKDEAALLAGYVRSERRAMARQASPPPPPPPPPPPTLPQVVEAPALPADKGSNFGIIVAVGLAILAVIVLLIVLI